MTITSTGPSGFHLKSLVTVLAAVAIVAGILEIVQVTRTDNPQRTSAPANASAQATQPYTGPAESSAAVSFSGRLIEGLGDGPLADAEMPAANQPAPEIVVIEGQGSLYDPLIEGKYDQDFSPGDPAVQYVLIPNASASASSQLVEGLGDATFAQRPPTASPKNNTPTVSGGPQQ